MRTPSKILVLAFLWQLALPLPGGPASVCAQELPGEDPSFKERKTEEGFTLDLKELIQRSKKKIEQVDDKLKVQAKERRNQQREEKAREYFEKAQEQYEHGDFDKARELWEKAIKITEHEEMTNYISQSVRRQAQQEKALKQAEKKRIKRLEKERGYTAKEVNKKYREGVKLYKSKKYLAAKVVFEDVDEMFPNHKATASYIALINDNIESDQKKRIEEQLGNKTFTSAKAKARWKKELQEQENIRQKELRQRADTMYKEAVRLYKDKQFKAAKEKFKEVEWLLPDYKRTIRYLSRIDEDIKKHGVTFTKEDKVKFFKKEYKRIRERDEWAANNKVDPKQVREFTEDRRRREEAAFVYDAALTLYHKDYHKQALEKFYEVQALYPDYKKTQKYIRKLHKKVPDSENQFTRMRKQSREKAVEPYQPLDGVNEQVVRAVNDEERTKVDLAEGKYQQALTFYNQKNFTEAQRKFIAVESILPGYKATREYLRNIDGDIADKQTRTAKKKGRDKKKSRRERSSRDDAGVVRAADTATSQMSEGQSYRQKYRQAKKLFKAKNYDHARNVFSEVNRLKPGFRSTEKYLARIDRKIKENKKNLAETPGITVDNGIRNVAKKVEPIPGMNSGVPQTYPKQISQDSPQVAEARGGLPAPKSVVKQVAVVEPDQDVVSDKKMTEKEVKALNKNRKQLDRMRTDPTSTVGLTKRQLKSLEKNRQQIEKELARQQNKTLQQIRDVVGETYKEAMDLYKLEQYAAAKAKFTTVEGIKPGYKRAAYYSRKSDEKLMVLYQTDLMEQPDRRQSEPPEAEMMAAASKPSSKSQESQSNLTDQETTNRETRETREKTLEELAAEIDDDYYHPISDIEYSRRKLESNTLTEEETRKARAARLERLAAHQDKKGEVLDSIAVLSKEELKEKYQLAKKLYRAKNYAKAKTLFAQISDRQADYKATPKYIRKIDVILDRQKVQRERYRKKMARQEPDEREEIKKDNLQNQQNQKADDTTTEARAKSDDELVIQRTEAYFDSAAKGAGAQRGIQPISEDGSRFGFRSSKKADEPAYAEQLCKDLYKEARKFYRQKDYAESRSLFARVEQMRPGYKSTRSYLKKIEAATRIPEITRAKNSSPEQKLSPALPASNDYRDDQATADYRAELARQQNLDERSEKLAKMDRLQRKEQQKIRKMEKKDSYRDSVEAQMRDQERIRKDQEAARRLKDKRARQEEKERERDALRAQRKLKKKITADLMAVRRQALDSLENNEESKAQVHINKFEELLAHGGFSNKQRARIKKAFNKKRAKIEKKIEKQRLKEEASILSKTDISHQERDKLSIKQQRELEKLEERILLEEQKLADARKKEELRLQKEAEKKSPLAQAEEKAAAVVDDRRQVIDKALDNVNVAEAKSKDVRSLAELEREKKRQIEELVLDRQKDLKAKRVRVQREFEKSLAQMYKKAIRLYKKDIYEQSATIFQEIQRMRPGYKKTERYLSKIDEAVFERRAEEARRKQHFQTRQLNPAAAQVARPSPKSTPTNRLHSIKNALDDFEEKMW